MTTMDRKIAAEERMRAAFQELEELPLPAMRLVLGAAATAMRRAEAQQLLNRLRRHEPVS